MTMNLPRVPTAEELEALLAACPRHTRSGTRDRAAILLTADTGARPIELLSIFVDHVDMPGLSISTPNAKRKPRGAPEPELTARLDRMSAPEKRHVERLALLSGRSAAETLDRLEWMARPISARAGEALSDWLKLRRELTGGARPDLPLFVTIRAGVDRLAIAKGLEASGRSLGAPWTLSGFRGALRAASTRAGLTSAITARSLRHFVAVRAYRHGKDLLHARDVLGHSSAATTEEYLRSLQALDGETRRAWLEGDGEQLPSLAASPALLAALIKQLAALGVIEAPKAE
tara:strand:+ start:13730 stop:14596 length:867 start_codon:yes stop_codon:yes gene_type:complete